MTILTDTEVTLLPPKQLQVRVGHRTLTFPIQPHQTSWLTLGAKDGVVEARVIVTELRYLVVEAKGCTLTFKLTGTQAGIFLQEEAARQQALYAEPVEVCA